VRDIAELAEVSDATVYNYFPAKDDIVLAVIDERSWTAELINLVRARPDDEGPVQAVLAALDGIEWPTRAEARQQIHMREVITQDPHLHGFFLRVQAQAADELAGALLPRAVSIGMDEVDVRVMCRCVVVALDVVADAQHERVDLGRWRAAVQQALRRIASGWEH
jgi:AcrR family transcriptional regulator